MTLDLLKRSEKGSALTSAEHDTNFTNIETEVNAKIEADSADTLTNKVLGEVKETVFTVTDGASVDLDPADGPIQTWTLGANRTPTATNFEAGQSMLLMVDDGTAYSITWTTIGVTWVGGSAPTLATSGYTVIELWKVGSTVYGAHVGDVA